MTRAQAAQHVVVRSDEHPLKVQQTGIVIRAKLVIKG